MTTTQDTDMATAYNEEGITRTTSLDRYIVIYLSPYMLIV